MLFPRDHPLVARNLDQLVHVHMALGAPATALPLAERVIAIYDATEGSEPREYLTRFALAKALVATGGDRARARALAEQARDGGRAADDAPLVAEIDAWLRDTP